MITLFTVISFIGTVVLAVLFHNIFGYELTSFGMWLIIPVGAIGVGICATSGLFYGYFRLNKPVTKRSYLVGLALGIIVFFMIHYTVYLNTYITPNKKVNYSFIGDHISSYAIEGKQITFSNYLALKLQSSKWRISFAGI